MANFNKDSSVNNDDAEIGIEQVQVNEHCEPILHDDGDGSSRNNNMVVIIAWKLKVITMFIIPIQKMEMLMKNE